MPRRPAPAVLARLGLAAVLARLGLAAVLACLGLALLGPAAGGLAAEAQGATTGGAVVYQEEGLAAYEAQLKDHEIREAAFNYVAHHLHLTLEDGRHIVFSYYPTYEPRQVEAQLKAHGVPIVSLTTQSSGGKSTHHKLRYLLAGLLVVVILIVLAVLLLGRRRAIEREASPGAEATPPEDAPPTADARPSPEDAPPTPEDAPPTPDAPPSPGASPPPAGSA